jgi:hypothetical protein
MPRALGLSHHGVEINAAALLLNGGSGCGASGAQRFYGGCMSAGTA